MKLLYISKKNKCVYKFLIGYVTYSLKPQGPSNIKFYIPKKKQIPFFYCEGKAYGKPITKFNSNSLKILEMAIKELSKIRIRADKLSLLTKRTDSMKKRAIDVFCSNEKYISDILKIKTDVLKKELKSAASKYICHGDLNPNSNVFYDDQTRNFSLIDFEDSFIGLKQFDQIFFIFYSGEKHWRHLFISYRKSTSGRTLTSTTLRQIMIWFIILKLSKLSKIFLIKYNSKKLKKRLDIIVQFKSMIDIFNSYV